MHRAFLLLVLSALLVMMLVSVGCGDDDDDESADDDDNDAAGDDDDDDDDTDAPPLLKVGFARQDVTPTVSVQMAGYGSFFLHEVFCRWSEGVHDPLYAHAVAFEDENGRGVILIVLDNVGTIVNEVVEIQKGVAAATGLAEANIVVAATHNHHGPDTIGMWGLLIPPRSGRNEDYIDDMVAKSIQAGVEAWTGRVPAELEYAVGEDSRYHFNYITRDPDALLDSTMTVLAAYDIGGALLGTVMNWAAHPTVMRHENRLISSDYPGAYYQAMSETHDGIHMYVNGSIGASIQPYNPERDGLFDDSTWEDWETVGGALAQTATTLLTEGTGVDDTEIWLVETRDVRALVENILFWLAAVFDVIPREVPPVGQEGTTYMSTFALGPITFGTMPGEFVPDYGFAIRDLMGGEAQVLIGMGMDWAGYGITPDQYQDLRYIYERFLCPSRWLGEDLMDVYHEIWDAAR